MALKLKEKTKDYITIWNEAIAGIYMAFSFLMIGSFISSIQSCMEFKAKYSSTYAQEMSCGVTFDNFDNVLLVVMIIVMFAAGLSNFFYTRRFFRDGIIKTMSGYVATITLAISNVYLVYLVIRSLVESSSVRSISILSYVSGVSWMTWLILIAIVISLIFSILAMINVFTWSPITIDSEEDGDSKKEPEIAADVATHAMGHPAPKAPEKKELPPMLNADPDAQETEVNTTEHKIVMDRPMMAQGNDTPEMETKQPDNN